MWSDSAWRQTSADGCCRVLALPENRIGQVFSAWAGNMDDPLRITTDRGMLFARLEAQQARTTAGVPLTVGKWYHIAAVKSGTNLTLFLDSQHKTTAVVPATLATAARSCALGGNPNYSGNEFLAADFAGFSMALRAFTTEEVQVLAQPATK